MKEQEKKSNAIHRGDEYWDAHVKRIIEILKSIPVEGKVTVLTGGNGRGKSMVRKFIHNILTTIHKIENPRIATVSMDKRAGIDPTQFMGFNRDVEWDPTSMNTFRWLEMVNTAEGAYVVLDEIEIGMSEESQYGVALYINNLLDEFKKKNLGMLIVTHSRYLVEHVNADMFLNIEGMTKEEWLNREIVPTDFEQLDMDSHDLYCAFDKVIKRK